MSGGSLLETIESRGHLTEQEASLVIRDIAKALSHLHGKGIFMLVLCAQRLKLMQCYVPNIFLYKLFIGTEFCP